MRFALLFLLAAAPDAGTGPLPHIRTETRDVPAFERLQVEGALQVRFEAGERHLDVTSDALMLKRFEATVQQGVLRLRLRARSPINLAPDDPITVVLKNPDLRAVTLSGASRVQGAWPKALEEAEVTASGASAVDLSGLDAQAVRLKLSGSSRAHLTGKAGRLQLESSGASGAQLEDLAATTASVSVSGSSRVSLSVAESLDGKVSGASRLEYTGEARHVSLKGSGASSYSRK